MSHPRTCSCTRRSFLKGSGLTLAGFGLTSLFPGAWIRHAMAGGASSQKRLLFIFMRGGNDGINAVLPIGDSAYGPANRPTLYIPPASAVSLGNGFAYLHPKLADLMPVFNAGDLAVIHRVGFPNNSRSHFDDQRVWENGSPSNAQSFEGWLYRYVQANAIAQGVDIPVLTSQATPPVITRGASKYVNVSNPDAFNYLYPGTAKQAKFKAAWLGEYQGLDGLEPHRPALSDAGVKLIDTLDTYESWDQLNWNPTDPNTGWSLFPVSDATNPPDPSGPGGLKFATTSYGFFRNLKVCALALLESDPTNTNGTRLAGTEIGNFDTHDTQGQLTGNQPDLLSWLAYGIRSLHIVLSGAASNNRAYPSIWSDTVVVTLSEFGRTSKENGSLGTDHAAATCTFAAGGAIQGGVYNCDAGSWATGPSGAMFEVNGRYLSHRTDYRAIFWEILRDHMGADPGTADIVFPGYTSLGLTELGLV